MGVCVVIVSGCGWAQTRTDILPLITHPHTHTRIQAVAHQQAEQDLFECRQVGDEPNTHTRTYLMYTHIHTHIHTHHTHTYTQLGTWGMTMIHL